VKIVVCSSHHWSLPPAAKTGHIVILDLAIALRELGHDVSLCAPTGTDFPNLLATEATEGRGEPTQPQMEQRALWEYAAEFDAADIIHDISTDMTVARAYPKKSIATPLGGSWDSCRGCSNIVVQSHSHRERALRGATDYENTEWPNLAGPPQTPVREARVVHDGINTDWYTPRTLMGEAGGMPIFKTPEPDAQGRYWDYAKDDFYLWLGRWAPSRGYKLVIELAKYTGIPLVMSGERPEDARFDAERNCALEAVELAKGIPNIRFEWLPVEGHHEAKRELYRRAKAFFMVPRFQEPFGLQQVEAMACGTPVIGLRIGSVPEVTEHGKTGLVVEPAFLHQACAKIHTIDPAVCRAEAVRRFDRKVMAANYVQLYQELLNGGGW
jgi:glycosyltransferase involved in cell wall biosynthesis